MRIGMILDRPFPPDDRVEKEAGSLISAGHQVHLLCFRHNDELPEEKYNGISVQRVYMQEELFKKLSALILILPFYRWFWKHHISKFVRRNKIEVLHIHDLPLVGTGLEIKSAFAIPLVADMHEDYADWIVHTEHLNTFWGGIIKKLSYWKKYEKKCLQKVDFIIGVSGLLINKMVSEHHLNRSKIVYTPNSPDLSKFIRPNIPENIKNQTNGKFNIIYAGGIDYLRGLQNVLPVFQELKQEISNIQLIIIGEGSFKKKLYETVKLLDLEHDVIFTGWLSIEHLASYLNCADVGIYPQLTYGGIEFTIPTKLYQYCAAGLPVIANNQTLPKKFLETNKCGFVVNFEESKNKFSEMIIFLNNNIQIRLAMGARGQSVIIKKYDWNITVLDLKNMYTIMDESR